MVDWQGLLKFSMQYHDGTKPSEFKEMSPEDAKFLEEALSSVTFNEFKETIKRLDELKSLSEEYSDEIIEQKLLLIEDISVLCDNLDVVRNIVKAKRFEEIIKYVFETKNKELRLNYCSLLSLMLQNHKFAQEAAVNFGILNLVDTLLSETDEEVLGKLLYVIGGVLYGDYTEARKSFINQHNGLEVLRSLLQRKYTKYLRRVISILVELSKPEDLKEDQIIREQTLDFLKSKGNFYIFVDLLFGAYKEDPSFEDIRQSIYNLFKNIYSVFPNKDMESVFEKARKLLISSSIDKSVKDHELNVFDEIISYIKQEENVGNVNQVSGNVNVHFLDPKQIKLEAKDLEGVTIIENQNKKKEEKKEEETKVLMLK